MKLWDKSAGPRTVSQWIMTFCHRAAANAVRNDELSDEQRALLEVESATYTGKAGAVRAKGRAIEDAEDGPLSKTRAEAFVTDKLADRAQEETHAILGTKKAVLAQAGTTREDVMGGTLTRVKTVGRERTVAYARHASREVSQLPPFAEREVLAAKLTKRADDHEQAANAVEATENGIEVEYASPLGATMSQLRVEVVQLRGRLLAAKLPQDFVDSLFPSTEAKARPEEPPPAIP